MTNKENRKIVNTSMPFCALTAPIVVFLSANDFANINRANINNSQH